MGKLMELYLKNLSKRYRQATKRREKSTILQKPCESSGFHKKHAIRLLNLGRKKQQRHLKKGRPNVHPESLYLEPLKQICVGAK